MHLLNLHLVYDFAHRSPRFWVILIPLVMGFVSFYKYYYNKNFVSKESKSFFFGIHNRRRDIFSGIVGGCLSVVILLAIIFGMLPAYFTAKRIYDNKEYQTVEGEVENFHPTPEKGKDPEKFDVKGIFFYYSGYEITDFGYNNTASHGGVIKEGLHVRIGYFNNGQKNVILKLEIEY